MQSYIARDTWKLLAVTSLDLYIPILTLVFGEAQVGGALLSSSYHRLRQELYGLPEDLDVLADRLLIEAVHELGHTLRLTHCDDYRCAMAPSHAVEWIDLKTADIASRACRERWKPRAEVGENSRQGTVLQAAETHASEDSCQGTTSVVPISTLLRNLRAGFSRRHNLFLGFFSGLCRQKPSFLALSPAPTQVCEGPDVSLRRVNAGPSTAIVSASLDSLRSG